MQIRFLKIFVILLCIANICHVYAVSAYPDVVTVRQPDGSSLAIRLYGDERGHFTTTTDNKLIVQNEKGIYYYATLTQEGITAGNYKAHNADERTTDETLFLKTIDQTKIRQSYKTQRANSIRNNTSILQKVPLGKRLMEMQKQISTTNKVQSFQTRSTSTLKELVILVNFSDTVFTTSTPQTAFTNLFNLSGYNGNGGTGSVRDYYIDNSMGYLTFDFTVVGTVTLSHPMAYYGANTSSGDDIRPANMVAEACQLASSSINFSLFDNDGDGYVDNVFIVYAGHNEAESGAVNSVWPHSWALSDAGLGTPTYNGVKVNGYACTSEMKGVLTSKQIAPIGTFCHEFGHTLGLLDLYDTDYTGTGIEAGGLANWDLMSTGNYNNSGRTPPYLCALDRWLLGWCDTQTPTSSQSNTLGPIGDVNKIFRINLPTANEFYLLENRQLKSWDSYLSGHGMLITHVDMATLDPWNNNLLNVNPSHQYVDLIEADGNETYTTSGIAGDSYPGTTKKTEFSDASYPSMGSWYSATALRQPITDIAENSNITFNFCGGPNGGLTAPVATKATQVSDTSFVANWGTISCSNISYYLDVYQTDYVAETEDFAGFLSQTDANGWSGNYSLNTTTFGSSPCAIKLKTSKNTITSKTYSAPLKAFSFWAMSDGTTGATLKVEAYNGRIWQTIQQAITLTTTPQTISYTGTTTPTLPNGIVQVRFTFSGSSGNVYIDDVTATLLGKSYLANYQNRNVGSAGSCIVNPVIKNVPYFYVVRAQSPVFVSPNSNEIEVIPIQGRNNIFANAYVNQGNLIVEAHEVNSNFLKVYTITGQKIIEKSIEKGATSITSLPKHALYIVVVNGRSFKVVL